jgi:hypothetical protein
MAQFYNIKTENVADYTNNLANAGYFIEIYSVSAGVSVAFKSFLKSFNDSLKLNWATQDGGIYRQEPLVNYRNLERTINISFAVPAAELEEAKENFGKLQTLIRFLYPNHEFINNSDINTISAQNFVAPPLVKIYFQNWISKDQIPGELSAKNGGLLGYIDGITFNPEISEKQYFFEGETAYPSDFEISFNFTVLNQNKVERKFLTTTRSDQADEEIVGIQIIEPDPSGFQASNLVLPSRIGKKTSDFNIYFVNPSYNNMEIPFKAYLKDFNDSFSSNWNKSDVFGKTDKLATYKNTNRKLNFKFAVPAETEGEAVINYNKINNLIALLYPGYDASLKIKNAPYMLIYFTNLISNPVSAGGRLFGYIDQIDFVPDMESSFFSPRAGLLYPMNYEVSITFNVLNTIPLSLAVPRQGSEDGKIEKISDKKIPYGIMSKYFEG